MMDLRCTDCQKLQTENGAFREANEKAIKEGWDGCVEITMFCKHIGSDWNFKD